MKLFGFVSLAMGCIFLVDAQAALEVKEIVGGFHEMSMSSHNLYVIVESINLHNLYLTGPKVEDDFRGKLLPKVFQFVVTVADIGKREIEFDDGEASTIAEAWLKFVEGHKKLLSMLFGRFGLLASFGFDEGIKNSLTLLETAEDALTDALIALIPTCETDLRTTKALLDEDLKAVIIRYGGKPKDLYYNPSAAYVEKQDSKTSTHASYEHSSHAEEYYAYYRKVAEYYRIKATEYYERLEPKQQRVCGSTYD